MKLTLDEDTLPGGIRVKYKGKEYLTGNRMGNEVELYKNNLYISNFHKIVKTKDIEIVDIDKMIAYLEDNKKELQEEIGELDKLIREFK